jgi:DNA processing protein
MTFGSAPPSRGPLTERERFDRLRLVRSETIGPRTFLRLLDRYGTAGRALEALPELIRQGTSGRPIRIATIEEIEQELALMHRCGGTFVSIGEPDYPPALAHIAAAPPVLAVRGTLVSLLRSKIAIVGSRNASAAGLAFTEQLARGLARGGHVIVSGLARGIDARAHQATLEAGTIAVLAGGLGKVYPTDHAPLLDRLLEHGAAVSEMPFGWEPRGRDFPRRNRIISGLSRAIVVVEAARGSGSLWTAKFAAEQGREIFAVPGSPLDPRAEGPNALLRDGAGLCTKAEDVLEALARQSIARGEPRLGFAEASPADEPVEPLWDECELWGGDADAFDSRSFRAYADLLADPVPEDDPPIGVAVPTGPPSDDEPGDLASRVTELLGPTPISVDELIRASRAQAREVQAVLLQLELAGHIERHGGDLVSLVSRPLSDQTEPESGTR